MMYFFRAGKGKMRNKRYKRKLGPIVVYGQVRNETTMFYKKSFKIDLFKNLDLFSTSFFSRTRKWLVHSATSQAWTW